MDRKAALVMTQDQQPEDIKTAKAGKPARPADAGAAERYPTPRRGRLIVMVLFLLVAVCGVMVPVLLANNGRNLQIVGDRIGLPLHDWWRGKTGRVATPANTAPAETAPAPQHQPIPAPSVIDPPTHLLRPAQAWRPEQDCNAMEPGATGEKPVFLMAPDGRSECTVLIALSDAEKASSLFLQVRAAGENLSSLRMKLNFGEDGKASDLVDKAGEIASRILSPISESERAYFQEKVSGRQAFRTEMGDYRITFRGEGNDTSRFNFIAVSKIREPVITEEEQNLPEGGAQRAEP